MDYANHILLIRHGQSTANLSGVVCGQTDCPLTSLGIRQAETLKRTLKSQLSILKSNHPIYAISSPLQRSMETARISLPPNVGPVESKSDLVEIDTGQYSNLTFGELYRINPTFRRWGSQPDLRYPLGESYRELEQRVMSLIDREFNTIESRTLLVFSHSGILNMILQIILEMPAHRFPAFELDNCAITSIRMFENRWRINFINRGAF